MAERRTNRGWSKKSGGTSRAKGRTTAGKTSDRTRKSKHFQQAKARAEKILHDPVATKKLVAAAEKKSDQGDDKSGHFSDMREHLAALLRLIRSYATGDYRAIPWESLLLIVAAIIYFVSPVDAIPDFLPVGLVDDAAVIAFVISVVAEELEDFMQWEKRQGGQ